MPTWKSRAASSTGNHSADCGAGLAHQEMAYPGPDRQASDLGDGSQSEARGHLSTSPASASSGLSHLDHAGGDNESLYAILPWLRPPAPPRRDPDPNHQGRSRAERSHHEPIVEKQAPARPLDSSPSSADTGEVWGFLGDAAEGQRFSEPPLNHVGVSRARPEPTPSRLQYSPAVYVPSFRCDAFQGLPNGIYETPRTYRPSAVSPWERLICRLMARDLDIPLHPPSRRFGRIRVVTRVGGGDNPPRSVTTAPGWIDTWRGVRIYSFVDSRDGILPAEVGGDGPAMPDAGPGSLAYAVLNLKLLIEMLGESFFPWENESVKFRSHQSDFRYLYSDGGVLTNTPMQMEQATDSRPAYPVRELRRLLRPRVGEAGLGIELRRDVGWTQYWSGDNRWSGTDNWAVDSETWSIPGALSENRVLFDWDPGRNEASRPNPAAHGTVVDWAWYFGPRTTLPRFSDQLIRFNNGVASTVVKGTIPAGYLVHELGHLALKMVGLQKGHGDKYGGPRYGVEYPSPISLTQQASLPDKSAYHRSPHWYCSHLAALVSKFAFGLQPGDPRGWTRNVHLRHCADAAADPDGPFYYGGSTCPPFGISLS